jgi:hypothetical protein
MSGPYTRGGRFSVSYPHPIEYRYFLTLTYLGKTRLFLVNAFCYQIAKNTTYIFLAAIEYHK